jgi:sacsin
MKPSCLLRICVLACADIVKLAELQAKLASEKRLSGETLQVFVSLLEEAAERFKDADFSSWKVPDIDGVMHEFCEMTVGTSRHDEESEDAIIKTLHFLHPSIGKQTIDFLRFPSVQDRFLEKRVGPEFIQDFEQGQKLTTIISDALQRYPIEDTFNEYLANAEDSGGAHKITWAVDAKSKHPKGNLITGKLKDCMGEAILCHNDGIFSRKDLDSLTDIGNSSKRDEPSKIGRFGRGSLTMYHWTCVPSFVTGDHFVIMDPEQKRLPNNPTTRQPRKGMLLSIRDVRQICGFS